MAPKKGKGKGKGDKLARMSVEQRQQYLDRRAAQEAESNRRREELVAGFLKLKLADEGQKGDVNEAKLMCKWRDILRAAKTTTLRAQLKELNEIVDETTTRQDRLISLLASQVDQAQHQRTTASHNHLSAVHKLTELHEDHVAMLTQYVRSREAEVARTMAGDTEHLAAHHLHSLRRLSLISHASQRHHDLTEKEELAAFHTTITHVTTQLEEELAAARVERESVLEDSWAKLAQSMRDHEAHTASLRANCHHLQERVSTNQKNLVKVNQGISDMQQEVEQLRKRLKQQDEESDAAQELQHLKSILQVLRVSLTTHRLRSRTLIKAINQRGYSAKKQLEEVAKEGKAVLELASACRRLETPRDRNIPFMPTAPQPSAASVPDDTLTTRLLSVPSEPASEVQVRPAAKDLETQVAMNSDADEGLGTSVNSSRRSGSTVRAPLRKVSSVMEADEGVASVNGSSSTTATPLTLPKIPVVAPGKGGSAGGRGSGRGSGRQRLGRDKLARINELLNHEEAAQEAAHTHGPDRSTSLDPPPDFVLQEADTVLKTHDDLRNFWRKYHHVQLERLALRSEAEALRQEGQQLRARLRYYLVSLGMTDAALTQTAAPVTVSHVTLSLSRKDDTPAKRRSKSVPAGVVGGRMMARAAASKGPLIVQEGGLLVKAAAMHSTRRIFT